MLDVSRALKLLGGRAVLDRLDLCCVGGEIAVVSGANGCGKSTLLRAISGVFEIDAGEISIGGHSLRHEPRLAKAELGYAPDGLDALPDLRAGEFVALIRGLKSLPGGSLPSLELEWRERLGFAELSGRRLSSLSFGQRKRTLLCAAQSGAPELLLLDEPSSGLDPEGVDHLVELIRSGQRAGRCHVITTNDDEFAVRVDGKRHWFQSGVLTTACRSA